MRRQKRTPVRRKAVSPRKNAGNGAVILLTLSGFVLVVLHLGARVQIEEVLRETDRLRQEKIFLEQKTGDLRIQLNGLRSYERISRLARNQGLVSVRSRDIGELPVDLSGLSVYTVMSRSGWHQAGFQPLRLDH
ncbi:MAG TPA: hypothetical protein ENN17_11650 [bacterium]|nr:hypothetical protein [bacterium]